MLASMLFSQQKATRANPAEAQAVSSSGHHGKAAAAAAAASTNGHRDATSTLNNCSLPPERQVPASRPLHNVLPNGNGGGNAAQTCGTGQDKGQLASAAPVLASQAEHADSIPQPPASQQLPDLRMSSDSQEPASNLKSTPNPQASLSAQHGQNAAASGSLTCNELDPSRRARLQNVVDLYLPPPLKARVRYTMSYSQQVVERVSEQETWPLSDTDTIKMMMLSCFVCQVLSRFPVCFACVITVAI